MAAQATVITFDDLTCSTDGTEILNSYAGLNWSNFWCVDASTNAFGSGTQSGYYAGRVSGSNVVLNGFENPAEFTLTAPGAAKFNLNSVYLTAAWNDDLVVTITAWRDGTALPATTHTLSATAPTLVTLNLSQIDRVHFASAGGTKHADYTGGDGTHFVMDNLDISFVSPPPTGVTATPGNALATVGFTPAPANADNPITGYEATCTPQGGGTAVTATGAGSPIVVTGLTNGTSYNCTVKTLNDTGGSVPSDPVTVTPRAAQVTAVPTLSEWGLMLLGLLAAGLGARRLRRG